MATNSSSKESLKEILSRTIRELSSYENLLDKESSNMKDMVSSVKSVLLTTNWNLDTVSEEIKTTPVSMKTESDEVKIESYNHTSNYRVIVTIDKEYHLDIIYEFLFINDILIAHVNDKKYLATVISKMREQNVCSFNDKIVNMKTVIPLFICIAHYLQKYQTINNKFSVTTDYGSEIVNVDNTDLSMIFPSYQLDDVTPKSFDCIMFPMK